MASRIEDYALIGDCETAALVGRVPIWSPELAITGKPGGKGALEEALAQTAPKHA